MKLHHCAFRITRGSSHQTQRLFEHLGAELVWEEPDQGREIAMRLDDSVIQFSEVLEAPTKTKTRIESHIAFSSNEPEKAVAQLRSFLEKEHIQVRVGKWSEEEYWVDCPELFVDFAIEILNPKKATSQRAR